METFFEINRDKYLRLHADCIPVRGASRSAICDLTRSEIVFFPSDYFEILDYLLTNKLGALLDDLECEEEKVAVIEFVRFLNHHELIIFLKDPSLFPPIEEKWDFPAIIQNAIIDVKDIYHDFASVFEDLDALGCQFIQVRSFSNMLQMDDLNYILSASYHKSIQGVELILKYDEAIPDDMYIRMMEEQPIISSLVIHSCPEDRSVAVDYGCDDELGRYIKKTIRLISQVIGSENHCGIITANTLNPPTVSNFFETKLYNGCLNRKVSIDANGEIKNCPSMRASFGNIADTSLRDAINIDGFKNKWYINKEQIETCRDCEFRYVCSDCRAYLQNPDDVFSKPLKCGYNPYTNIWEEWSNNPLKEKAIRFYGMEDLVSAKPISNILSPQQ